ncbi:type II secretion system F family protein [Achromobacter sp. Marseille-Q0513]|uniref:type II secretion system F family protein n=1 Tax=Achromobacter sp. Marseille-Q0513 TaxID=2829161 RepID=UPI001B9B1A7D|nr:type II secretion system F family protein [Achromobacter sp. Marseille-Q0513]MBR8654559.1 type II secretion system F family protein [Achromobacter sp. Marseille-Q0513]
MQQALVLAALALVLAVAAVLLWRHANSGARRAASSAFLENQLRRARDVPVGGATFAGGGRAARSGFSWWDRLLLLAGLRHGAGLYLRIFAPIVTGALLAWAFLGALSGFVTLLLLTVGAYFLLWLRADKRQRRMISQLPAFLDNMVRLITIGNSMASAFQTAAASADEPLREVVETAAALSRSAKELDEALAHVSRQYGLKELYMVAAVVSIALRFGGRSDQVLERMAAFMRDVSQARSELSASSAEIRLSAWILALLPLGIAGFIIVANNDLFVGLWEDPLGFKMLTTAVAMQVGGSYWLYRMAKSI